MLPLTWKIRKSQIDHFDFLLLDQLEDVINFFKLIFLFLNCCFLCHAFFILDF